MNSYGETPLHNAISKQCLKKICLALERTTSSTIELLLKSHPLSKNDEFITTGQNKASLLYLCCKVGNTDAVSYLLSVGADAMKLQHPSGSISLHAAAFYSHDEVLSLILDKCPQAASVMNKMANEYPIVNAFNPVSGLPSMTAVCRILSDTNGDLYDLSCKNKINECAARLNTTVLHLAVKSCNLELVKKLLKDFDHTSIDSNGDMPIDVAIGDVAEYLKSLAAEVQPAEVSQPAEVPQPEQPVEVPQTEQPVEVPQPEQPVEVPQTEQPAEVPQPEQPAEVPQTEQPAEVSQTEQPVEVPQTEQPAEVPQTEQPVEVPQTEQPVEVPQPEQPVEVPQTEQPAEVPQPEQPAEVPQTEQPAEVSQTEQPVEVPQTEQPVEVPQTEQPVEVPQTEQPVEVPQTEQPAEVPQSEQPVEVPQTEQPVEVPQSEQPTEVQLEQTTEVEVQPAEEEEEEQSTEEDMMPDRDFSLTEEDQTEEDQTELMEKETTPKDVKLEQETIKEPIIIDKDYNGIYTEEYDNDDDEEGFGFVNVHCN